MYRCVCFFVGIVKWLYSFITCSFLLLLLFIWKILEHYLDSNVQWQWRHAVLLNAILDHLRCKARWIHPNVSCRKQLSQKMIGCCCSCCCSKGLNVIYYKSWLHIRVEAHSMGWMIPFCLSALSAFSLYILNSTHRKLSHNLLLQLIIRSFWVSFGWREMEGVSVVKPLLTQPHQPSPA